MKVEVRFRGLEASDAVREHVIRRVHFQLNRFEGGVSSVGIRIEDINGPKGGIDKRCQVTVLGPSFSPVMVDDLSSDASSAVDMAVDRAARAVGREIERGRAVRRRDGTSGGTS